MVVVNARVNPPVTPAETLAASTAWTTAGRAPVPEARTGVAALPDVRGGTVHA